MHLRHVKSPLIFGLVEKYRDCNADQSYGKQLPRSHPDLKQSYMRINISFHFKPLFEDWLLSLHKQLIQTTTVIYTMKLDQAQKAQMVPTPIARVSMICQVPLNLWPCREIKIQAWFTHDGFRWYAGISPTQRWLCRTGEKKDPPSRQFFKELYLVVHHTWKKMTRGTDIWYG